MLTVMIKRPNGQEEIFEAKEVEKKNSGLLCYTDHGIMHLGKQGYHTSFEDIDTKYELSPWGDKDSAAIFVMNRYGSTVATYHI